MRIIRVDRVHTALCGTEFTRARWLQVATPPHSYHGPCQIFTSASHHIASQVKQTRGTQCAAQRSVLTVGSRHERECHALFGPHVQSAIAQSSSIRIETTPGSGLGLIQIESGLGELMRIQCECVQTGFDPVQCALDVQVWTCLSQALLLTSNLIRLLAHS